MVSVVFERWQDHAGEQHLAEEQGASTLCQRPFTFAIRGKPASLDFQGKVDTFGEDPAELCSCEACQAEAEWILDELERMDEDL